MIETAQLFQLSRDEAIRRDKLRAELESYDVALENLCERMKDFRSTHCIFVDGHVSYVSDDPAAKVRLAAEWHGMWKHRDEILSERNICLASLAEMAKQ